MVSHPAIYTAFVVLLAFAEDPPRPVPTAMFTGLNTDALVAKFGWRIRSVSLEDCMLYFIEGEGDHREQPSSLSIGVFPSESQASAFLAQLEKKYYMPTIQPSDGSVLGHEFLWRVRKLPADTTLPDEHHMAVRRKNIVFVFNWVALPEKVQALAQKIDAIIRDDREVAPLGRWDEEPQIISMGAPERYEPRTLVAETGEKFLFDDPRYVFLDPKFRGLGPIEELRVSITAFSERGWRHRQFVGSTHTTRDGRPHERVFLPDDSGPRRVFRAVREDGRFVLVIRRDWGDLTLRMIAASKDNRIATLEAPFSLPELTPRPYRAVDLDALVAAFNSDDYTHTGPTAIGMRLRVPLASSTQPFVVLEDLRIRAHVSPEIASAYVEEETRMISIGPTYLPWAQCGDRLNVWNAADQTTVRFVRDNVTVYFRCNAPAYDAIAAASQIDHLIVNDRNVAPIASGDQ